MSKHGFGYCTLTLATYYSLVREIDCAMYTKENDAKIEKRVEWYEKRFK